MIKKAYAKINLGLKVIGKRSDEFHELETIMTMVSLFDEVEVLENEKLTVECENIEEKDNLVYKVAYYMKEKYKVKNGAKIIIKKRIPLQAGLGGGSSDAASTIEMLDKFWGLNLEKEEKKKIANMFGSDICFFLEKKPSYVTGKGENVTPFNMKNKLNVLLVKPKFGVSTGEAFSCVNKYSKSGQLLKVKEGLENGDVSLLKEVTNDLENSLNNEKKKKINIIKNELLDYGACLSLMSGSGSTVFGVFENKEKMEKAYKKMKEEGREVYATQTL